MTIKENTGLVLEGGGMRGVFTIGVLDYFLDRELFFTYNVAVSAAACNGLSYISKQRGRAKYVNIDLLEKYKYIGLKYLFTQRSILDQTLLYDKIPNEEVPFDYDACFNFPHPFEMVATDCRTGKACYLTERQSRQRLIDVAKASSSLPYVSPIVELDGRPMLDGGIADAIPVERAMALGKIFNVVVLTRNRGYRDGGRDIKLPQFVYTEYPRLRLLLSKRRTIYNKQLDLVERLEEEGRILCIRPQRPMEVDRLSSDRKGLEALYEEGYACAKEAVEKHLRGNEFIM